MGDKLAEKLPPHNLDAERSILGSILLDSKSINGCIDRIKPFYFYNHNHKIIFDCISGLLKADIIPDVTTVCSTLKDSKNLEKIGGYSYLASLLEGTPSTANISYYVDIIIELAERREAIESLQGEIEKLYQQPQKISEKASRGSIKSLVLEFIEATDGDFTATNVRQWATDGDNEGQWRQRETKATTATIATKATIKTIQKVLQRLCQEGIIEPVGNKYGIYRRIKRETNEIDIFSVDAKPLPISWPFRIQDLVHIYQKSLIVIAGEPNAGKTAMALNVAVKNCDKFSVLYFSSEMGAIELRQRAEKFNINMEIWRRIRFIERASDFADVIDPTGFNIIDFLEIHDNFYAIGGLMKAIFDKLTTGIALILIQKNKGKDAGLGGDRGLEKPRLYISMAPGLLKIVKGKNWVSEMTNPNGLQIKFKLANGCNFIKDGEWHKGE